jgi:PAS domain S-box-containing protein
LGAFVAFSCTVLLAQYLTRVVIVRMTAKEMEAARNQDVLSAVINAMKEGLLFLGNDGKQIFANPAAEAWKRQDTHGSDDPDEGLPEVLREEMLAHASSAAQETQAPWHIEFETDSEKPRYIEAQGRPVTDVQNRRLGYVIVGRDLTERRRLEKALRERTEDVTAINDMLKISRLKMAEREKMVAVGQMAAGIAHEIGNPLASLSSVVQYLARKPGLKEEQEQLDLILSQVTRISTILRRMLSISRPASTEHCWTQVEKVIAITLSLVEFDVRMDFVTLENVPSEGLPECWLNPQSLEQVLLNVLINALDAMVARGKDRPLVLRITKAVQDDCVEVRISDNGIGMEREVAERAFESFYSTKEAGKGTGLGLFVSCNLMKEMAGEIALESEAGQGTTVILKMPIRGKKDTMQGDSDVA